MMQFPRVQAFWLFCWRNQPLHPIHPMPRCREGGSGRKNRRFGIAHGSRRRMNCPGRFELVAEITAIVFTGLPGPQPPVLRFWWDQHTAQLLPQPVGGDRLAAMNALPFLGFIVDQVFEQCTGLQPRGIVGKTVLVVAGAELLLPLVVLGLLGGKGGVDAVKQPLEERKPLLTVELGEDRNLEQLWPAPSRQLGNSEKWTPVVAD